MGSQLEGDKELLIEMDGKLQVSRQIRASVAFLQPFVHLRMREDTPIMGHAKHSDFSRTHTVNPSPWQRKHHGCLLFMITQPRIHADSGRAVRMCPVPLVFMQQGFDCRS